MASGIAQKGQGQQNFNHPFAMEPQIISFEQWSLRAKVRLLQLLSGRWLQLLAIRARHQNEGGARWTQGVRVRQLRNLKEY